MKDRDMTAIAVLGAALALAWWASLPRGAGSPGLGSGRDRGGPDDRPSGRRRRGGSPASGPLRGSGSAGKTPAVIDVVNPEIVTEEEYRRRRGQ